VYSFPVFGWRCGVWVTLFAAPQNATQRQGKCTRWCGEECCNKSIGQGYQIKEERPCVVVVCVCVCCVCVCGVVGSNKTTVTSTKGLQWVSSNRQSGPSDPPNLLCKLKNFESYLLLQFCAKKKKSSDRFFLSSR
jgi:hypothetical protein